MMRRELDSRRIFLKKGIWGGILLLLGTPVGLFLSPSKNIELPSAPLLVLTSRGFNVIVALAARMIAVEKLEAVVVATMVDQALSYSHADTQADIRRLLALFENALAGFLLDGRIRPFTQLSGSGQDEVLENWRTSKILLRRTGYQALRKLVLGAYYTKETSFKTIPYAPPFGLNALAYDDSKVGTPEWNAKQVPLS